MKRNTILFLAFSCLVVLALLTIPQIANAQMDKVFTEIDTQSTAAKTRMKNITNTLIYIGLSIGLIVAIWTFFSEQNAGIRSWGKWVIVVCAAMIGIGLLSKLFA